MTHDIWVIAEKEPIRGAWLKVLAVLFGHTLGSVRTFSSVGELPEAPTAGNLLVLFGCPRDRVKQYAAWDLWWDNNCEVGIILCPQSDLRGFFSFLCMSSAKVKQK